MPFLVALVFLITGCASSQKPASKQTLFGTDVHIHVHDNGDDDMRYNGDRVTLAIETSSIERACILSHSYSRRNNPKCWVGKSKTCTYDPEWVRKTNQWTIDQAQRLPQLLPFCGVEIGPDIDSASEIAFCYANGAKGLKIHTQATGVDLKDSLVQEKFKKVVTQAGELGLPILIHAGTKNVREAKALIAIAESAPKTKFIFAHLLGQNYRLLSSAAKLSNVYAETSGTIVQKIFRNEAKQAVQVLREFGIDRVLFGSDWPVIHPSETLAILEQYPFTREEIQKIRGLNANSLFGPPVAAEQFWKVR